MNKLLSGLKRHESKSVEGPCYEGVAIGVESHGVQFLIVADTPFCLERIINFTGLLVPPVTAKKVDNVLVFGNPEKQ